MTTGKKTLTPQEAFDLQTKCLEALNETIHAIIDDMKNMRQTIRILLLGQLTLAFGMLCHSGAVAGWF